VEVKSKYYQQYVKNPQLRTSAFYPLYLKISSAKNHPHFTRFNICRSADPHFTTGPLLQSLLPDRQDNDITSSLRNAKLKYRGTKSP